MGKLTPFSLERIIMEDYEFYKVINDKQETGVFARFYDKCEKTSEILESGLPKFITRTWVKIQIQNSYDEVDTPATDEHISRFPREYQFYLTKKEKIKEGTPLNMFAFLTPEQIESCDLRGIVTVEQLARLDEEKALSLGLTLETELAKKFILMQANNKDISEYEKKIKELEDRIAYLENENKSLRENK